ncbi:mechanosensitive ion channel [Candidatus Woesearchaeota archaeon]|nr:mechanosensitive ion channel [Candidatus Woesearchaeota archaeon]
MTFSLLLSMRLFGNTVEQYLAVLLIIFITFFFAKIIFLILKLYFQNYAHKKGSAANEIINITSTPLILFFCIASIYYAVGILNLPDALQVLMQHLTVLGLTIVVSYYLLRLEDTLIRHYIEPYVKATESTLDDRMLPVLRKTMKVVVIVIATIIALNNLGYNVSSLLAGLGIGGLAVALAAQETIGNFFGSVSIFADRVFEVGDFVKIGEIRGTIKEVGMRSTRLETWEGTLIAIPNSKIASERIENFTQAGQKKVGLVLGITYDTTTKKLQHAIYLVKSILANAAAEGQIKDEYHVYFSRFGPSSLDIDVTYFIPVIKYVDWAPVVHHINTQIKQAFDRNKIEFAFPTQTLYVKR